jgi:hypothetical protein
MRVLTMYFVVQLASLMIVHQGCSSYEQVEFWTHGVLGPLAAIKVVPRFRYDSLLPTAGFVLLAAALLVAPAVHVLWPRRATLIVSAVALVVWVLFGMGLSIDHM